MYLAKRCRAKSKRTGGRCRAPALRGKDLCRHHGGKTDHRGEKNPSYKHGRHTKDADAARQERGKHQPNVRARLDHKDLKEALIKLLQQDDLSAMIGDERQLCRILMDAEPERWQDRKPTRADCVEIIKTLSKAGNLKTACRRAGHKPKPPAKPERHPVTIIDGPAE